MSNKRAGTASRREKEKFNLLPRLRFPEFRGAGDLQVTTIDNISSQITAGGTPDTANKSYWNGELRWMNSGDLNLKKVHEVQGRITEEGLRNSSTKVIPERSVLIGLAGQGKTRGTVAMNMVPLCTNQSIAAIFPNEATFNSDYLFHALDNRYEELRRLSAGGEGRGGLNLQIIKNFKVSLPSLREQKKVADCLSSIDELISIETQKLDTLMTQRKGLMQGIFPRSGEAVPRLRFPEFRKAGSWARVTAGQLFLNRTEKGHSRLPIYSVTMNDGMIPRSSLDRRIVDLAESGSNKKACKGDIAYNMMRMWQGALGVAPVDCMISPAYVVLKPLDGVNSVFYHYFLKLPETLQILTAHSRGLTEDRLRLYYDDFAKVPVPHPSYSEQKKIADCLSSIDDLIYAQSRKIDALKAHKKGLRQMLFPMFDQVLV